LCAAPAGAWLAGCQSADADPEAADDRQVVSLPLTAAENWAIAPASDDPFSAFVAGRVRCSPFALRREAGWLEVSTTECNYASLLHRFDRDVPAHAIIRGEVAWATLASLEPAVGTLTFATAEDPLWSFEVPIPGEADIVEVEFELSHAATAGSGLFFNVRNHGYNTWQLGPLTLEQPAGD
jgi:hypothetical protein